MNILTFLLVILHLVACDQHSEPRGEVQSWQTLKRIMTNKPKPAAEFVNAIMQNNKLINSSKGLDRRVRKYVKRGGNLNARLDGHGNTVLAVALRENKRTFAQVLINHKADKSQALRALLDTDAEAPNPQGWEEITWLIEQGATQDLLGELNEYVHKVMTSSYFHQNGIRHAIELGADAQQAFTLALRNKRQQELELLLEYMDEQQAFDEALQTDNYEIIKVLLEAKRQSGLDTRKDANRLLLKSLREERSGSIPTSYGATEVAIFDEALQARDYDTLELILKKTTWTALKKDSRAVKVLQTHDDRIVDLVLKKFENKKSTLNHWLGISDLREDYDTIEFIVKKGGDADVALRFYLMDIHAKPTRIKFDFKRTWNMVALGADPQELDLRRTTQLVMKNIVEESHMANDHKVLEFLFANLDIETIATMTEGRELLHHLVQAQQEAQQQASRYDELAELASKNGADTNVYQPKVDQDLDIARDKIIALLKEHKVPL